MSKEWYDKNYKDSEPTEFIKWFTGEYGNPLDYEDDKYEQDEYWIRRGFALMGWVGFRKYNNFDELLARYKQKKL